MKVVDIYCKLNQVLSAVNDRDDYDERYFTLKREITKWLDELRPQVYIDTGIDKLS